MLIVVCIGCATVIEKYRGTPFVGEHIYGAWWFSALWAVLTMAALAYIMEQRLYKRVAVFMLHMSFVVILAGALVTHLFARRGTVCLRTGMAEASYVDKGSRVVQLPFSLTLKEFRIVNYPGTDAPLDYQSILGFKGLRVQEFKGVRAQDGEVTVSMNNIGHIHGYRLFQQSFDSDGEGVTLGISYDPYGIAITYCGYLMLLVSIIATLLSRHTQMRSLYRKAMKPLVLLLLIFLSPLLTQAAPRLPALDPDIAHRMGTINVLYNNRICPLNTVATDFVTKLTGRASWEGYSADEIFVGWMIYYSPWEQQKLIRVKSHDVQQLLGIDTGWASYSDFLDEYHQYKLQDAIEALRTGQALHDGFPVQKNRKALLEADEKFHTVEMFYHGQFLRIFPLPLLPSLTGRGREWVSPGGQSLPRDIPVKEQFFIKQSMDFLTESLVTGQNDRAREIIAKIKLFQRDMIGDVLPSETMTKAEIFYNKLRSIKFPVLITLQLALRWWLSGHIPLSNGYETMLFMAWVLLLLTVLLFRKLRIMLLLGPLAALCCLVVAMLAGSGSQLTPLMPVLQSPLLSLHVMAVMCSYALFALQMLLSIYALFLMKKKKNSTLSPPLGPTGRLILQEPSRPSALDQATALSQFLLYPAVFLLATGIFLGAVWANVSWGSYWSWDPKESWALITLMVYAVPLHKASIPAFSKTRSYHLYIICAFFAVIITYFGVNYLLGGMHSYA